MSSRAEQSPYRTKPEGKSMHGRIVRELGLRILAGELAPGERLPAEAELIEKYEVSRPVLREAVRVLVAKGLVLSRQRAGAIVRPRNEWHLLDPDVLYWMIQTRPAPEFVQTLMGMRRVFEPGAAALAAQAATDEQLAGIAQAYDGMAAARRRRRDAGARPRVPPPHRRGHRQRPDGLHRHDAVAGAARVDQAEQPAARTRTRCRCRGTRPSSPRCRTATPPPRTRRRCCSWTRRSSTCRP